MIKLLVIEDEKILAENIKEIIADLGEVTLCFDGEEGLYEAQSKIYDLILLDLMLPKMNGYQVLAQLRQENIQTPVLILTAKDSLEDKITGFQKGATTIKSQSPIKTFVRHARGKYATIWKCHL